MKTFLSALLFGLLAALATNAVQAQDMKFDESGITFNHPKEWKVKAKTSDKKDLTTITAENGKGTTLTITLNDPSIDPKMISDELGKTFKKIFETKIVPGSDKPMKRKLLGTERDGQMLEILILQGVTSTLEYYAFKGPKNTISVTMHTTSNDPDGKKAVEMIADSLAEKK